jgi:hypothetical protein
MSPEERVKPAVPVIALRHRCTEDRAHEIIVDAALRRAFKL